MKALTIWQPWASLIIAGVKPYEFRGWYPPASIIGRRIAIHAGARPVRKAEIAELIAARPSEQCGCPEEEWIIANLGLLIHFEEDGSGHIIIDGGDWEAGRSVAAVSMDDLRAQAFAMVAGLPEETAHA